MSASQIEELLTVGWLIAALIAFSNGWSLVGWMLACKASADLVISLVFAWRETRGGLTWKRVR